MQPRRCAKAERLWWPDIPTPRWPVTDSHAILTRKNFIDECTQKKGHSPALANLLYLVCSGKLEYVDDVMRALNAVPPDAGIQLFTSYSKDGDALEANDILEFCKDIDVAPVDGKILVFAAMCGCEKMGRITLSEFVRGCQTLALEGGSFMDFRAQCVPKLEKVLNDEDLCRYVYEFTFDYARDSAYKCLPLCDALDYWPLCLKPHFKLYDEWVEFLAATQQPDYLVSRDLWTTLWSLRTKLAKSLQEAKEDDSWPVIIDDFLETLSDNKVSL